MTAHDTLDTTLTDLTAAVAAAQVEYDEAVKDKTTTTIQLAAKDALIADLRLALEFCQTDPGPVDPPVDPPPPVGALPQIPFKPPVLTNPITMDLSTKLSGGIVLDTTKDYILKLPTDKAWKNTSGLNFSGGRNVVCIGGLVDVGSGSNGVRRGGYFQKATGTVHIEGVKFISSAGVNFTEGLNISAASAIVQIANCHVATRTDGSQTANHADILQTWNGPKTLRVFGLKGKSNYQAMFLNAHDINTISQPVEGSWTFDRIDVEVVNGGYTLWLVPPPGYIKMGSKVHAYGGKGLWKPEMWTKAITGGGVITTAPTEDLVPTAGLGYVSPGYAAA